MSNFHTNFKMAVGVNGVLTGLLILGISNRITSQNVPFNQQNIDKIDTVHYLSSRNTDHNEFVLNQQRCHRCKQRKQKKNFP